MKTIVTHPDNAEWLRKKLEAEEIIENRKAGRSEIGGLFSPIFWSFSIKTNPHMERDKPSGRYRLPDGRTVPLAEICIRERFITYGPEDLWWLLWTKQVVEERERLFYEVDEMRFRFGMDFGVFKPHAPSFILWSA